MTTINTIIVDDEIKGRQFLRQLADKFTREVKIIGEAANAAEAKELIADVQPDLVFLDIEMPGKSGMDMLREMPEINFEVIFVSAFNKYAVEAFKLGAIDYLLKPVDMEELQAAVHRFIEGHDDYRQQYDLLKNIMYNMSAPSAEDFRLALPTKEGVHFLQPQEIIRCEAVGNYTKFFVTSGKSYLISKTLGEYDTLLTPQNFIRTHKSHLVNKKFISFIDHEGFAVLKDNTKVEVSRRRKEEVMTALK